MAATWLTERGPPRILLKAGIPPVGAPLVILELRDLPLIPPLQSGDSSLMPGMRWPSSPWHIAQFLANSSRPTSGVTSTTGCIGSVAAGSGLAAGADEAVVVSPAPESKPARDLMYATTAPMSSAL